MSTWSMCRSGRSGRLLDDDTARPDDALQGLERLVHQFVEREHRGSQLERAGLNAGHVEQVGDEPGQPIRLQLNQLEKLVPIGRVELGFRPVADSRPLS